MKNPVRLVLKKVKIDSRGQLLGADYKTFDIDSKELESLLFEASPHLRGKYEVVGAELLNESEFFEKYQEGRDVDF